MLGQVHLAAVGGDRRIAVLSTDRSDRTGASQFVGRLFPHLSGDIDRFGGGFGRRFRRRLDGFGLASVFSVKRRLQRRHLRIAQLG